VWRTKGQNETILLLENELAIGSLSHAYLLIGPKHIGKTTLSYDLAMAVNCFEDSKPCLKCTSCQRILKGLHSDIFYLGIENSFSNKDQKTRTEISIDDIKKVQQYAGLPPYEGKYKVFIIDGADQLSIEAANCLLKTLEEPPANIIMLLLTTDETKVLPTIASRCQRINLKPLPAQMVEDILTQEYSADTTKVKLIARLSDGCPGWAISCLEDDSELQVRLKLLTDMDALMTANIGERFSYIDQLENGRKSMERNKVESLINSWMTWWRDLLLISNNCSENVTNIDFLPALNKWIGYLDSEDIIKFIEELQNSLLLILKNANIRLILEVLMLDMPYPKPSK
jgi:DNA polymerase-3 subunit delta'